MNMAEAREYWLSFYRSVPDKPTRIIKMVPDKSYADMTWEELASKSMECGHAVGVPVSCLLEGMRRMAQEIAIARYAAVGDRMPNAYVEAKQKSPLVP